MPDGAMGRIAGTVGGSGYLIECQLGPDLLWAAGVAPHDVVSLTRNRDRACWWKTALAAHQFAEEHGMDRFHRSYVVRRTAFPPTARPA